MSVLFASTPVYHCPACSLLAHLLNAGTCLAYSLTHTWTDWGIAQCDVLARALAGDLSDELDDAARRVAEALRSLVDASEGGDAEEILKAARVCIDTLKAQTTKAETVASQMDDPRDKATLDDAVNRCNDMLRQLINACNALNENPSCVSLSAFFFLSSSLSFSLSLSLSLSLLFVFSSFAVGPS
jgi:hypothetical protein